MLATLLLLALAADPAPKPDAGKKVCRTDHVVGSRIPSKRVCRTAAEWAAEGRARDEAGRIQMEQSMGMSGRLMNPGGSF